MFGAGLLMATSTGLDPDALVYINAVQVADGQSLESGVVSALNDFVIGCKADGIWTAIKACCILLGARTLSGALVPLVGLAPTNVNFVSGDYNRKTGLKGNASNKYLNTNRNNNADPQNNKHMAIYVTSAATATTYGAYISAYAGGSGSSFIGIGGTGSTMQFFLNSSAQLWGLSNATGFLGESRSSASGFSFYNESATPKLLSNSIGSSTPNNTQIQILGESGLFSNGTVAFYSIGENLDLVLLRNRVSNLYSSISAVIP